MPHLAPRPLPSTTCRVPGAGAASTARNSRRHLRPGLPISPAPDRPAPGGPGPHALEHLSDGSPPEHQLALANQLVALLQNQAPRAISTADLLHPSARLLAEIRSKERQPRQAETSRPPHPSAPQDLAGRQGY
jgi:hypothetical protein